MASTNYIVGNPGNIQRASEFVTSNFEYVDDNELEVLYPSILYPTLLPDGAIKAGMAEGGDIFSIPFVDKRGVGDVRASGSNNIPQVGATLSKISVNVRYGSVGASIDLQDLQRSDFSRSGGRYGLDIISQLNGAMEIASERHIERTVWFGDAQYNSVGYINDPNIPQSVAAVGGSGFTEWSTKTPDEIIADIATGIIDVRVNSRTVFTPTTIYLPSEQFTNISYTKGGTRANDETITNYLMKNGFAANTWGQLKFEDVRYLAGAGVAGSDRMVIVTALPNNYLMAMPIPYRVIEPIQILYQKYLLGEYQFSGLKIMQPIAFAYVDGI